MALEWLKDLVNDADPYVVQTTHDLYAIPPVEFLIEDILPLYSIVGLTGFPGTGKTWLALEMMRAVTTGSNFLGKFQAKPAPVLFVGNDASLHDYAQQWRRLTMVEYGAQQESIEEGLRDTNPFNTLVHFLIESEFNFDDLNQVARLIRTSQAVFGETRYSHVEEDGEVSIEENTRQHFGLIVFDCVSKFTSAKEGDNTATAIAFDNVRKIAAITGATLVLLHHNASPSEYRTGEEWRGGGSSGAAIASLDAHYHLITKTKGVVEFKMKKMRGLTIDPFLFSLDVHSPGEASLDYLGVQETKEDTDEKLIQHLVDVLKARDNAPTTIADFAIATLAAFSERFDDIKKFKRYISNTLLVYCRKPDARIVAAIAARGGRATLYKLSPPEQQGRNQDEPDSGDQPDHDGTEES